uniref:Putative metal-dependent hydrolase related to alanyl-tRNA synthetase n=1 Tax=uncultured marine group III euryarchaeote SAT1000-53-B3 TaxID=526695 RepID=B3V689_9ARCH|nr:putative metal-dependent hydrolase related to alanyl-tRNA synthetase [uncultured marine group III euryarchaeote SAT1000-53-B3]
MTLQYHMDSHDGTYKKEFQSKVTAVYPGIVELEETAFYHLGGGQPSDKGTLNWEDGESIVYDVRKKNRIRHMVEGDLPEVGDSVNGKLNWDRRYTHMRMHTSQHLVSAIVSDLYGADTVGNQIGFDKSRIDFKPLKLSMNEIDDLIDRTNDYVTKDISVNISEANRSDLEGNPEIRSSMSSGLWKLLPKSVTRLRVISIDEIDVCPCAGTHVRSLKEIGKVEFVKRDNKGAGKQRLTYTLNSQS